MRSSHFLLILTLTVLLVAGISASGIAADLNGDGRDDGGPFIDRDNDGRNDATALVEGPSYRSGDGHDEGLPFVDKDNDGRNDLGRGSPLPDPNHTVIVGDSNPRAFFGHYRATQMPALGWNLLRRTIDWADGHSAPHGTDVLLFTYNNDLVWPVDYQQEDGFEVYSWLTARGYNITGHHQSDMATLTLAYFQSFDLIIYWNGYGYDCTTAVASGTPFISVSTAHATPMNLGGAGTMHQSMRDFYTVNNAHYPTAIYSLGPLTFESSMWTDGVQVLGEGVALVADAGSLAPAAMNHTLIVGRVNPRAFFGFYRTTQMTVPGWDLLLRTILWADDHMPPAGTNLLLFTYNNDLVWPVDYQQEDGFEVYTWLTAQGFNITGHHQWDMPDLSVEYYQTFDIILYWNSYGYDPSNAIDSGVPLVSVSTAHTIPMNIGSNETMHQSRQDFCVINNSYHPTFTYPLGPLTFGSPMWTDGVQVRGEGVVLIGDDCLPGDVTDFDFPSRIGLLAGPGPNPVLHRMDYSINLPDASLVDVGVFDVTGRLVQTLVHAELPAGSHEFRWDPALGESKSAPSGIYYLRARAAGIDDSRKFLLMR